MTDFDPNRVTDLARRLSERDSCDIFLYNGDIERGSDLEFIEALHNQKRHENCLLILVTNGGNPDAAYKMSRYAQEKYSKFSIILAGLCKSAGTLIAIGCHELVFTPYGELGPLDVQIYKEDKLSSMHSGLNISEALQTLEQRAVQAYLGIIGDIMKSSSGVVSFQTAAKAASDVIDALYSPIFGQFDPEDVGSRARSMRIAADYGVRLDAVSRNMKPGAVERLADTYPSHGFVIDVREATALFNRVRMANALEVELVEALGHSSRWPQKKNPTICLSTNIEDHDHATPNANERNAEGVTDRGDSEGTGKEAGSASGRSERNGRPSGSSAEKNIRAAE